MIIATFKFQTHTSPRMICWRRHRRGCTTFLSRRTTCQAIFHVGLFPLFGFPGCDVSCLWCDDNSLRARLFHPSIAAFHFTQSSDARSQVPHSITAENRRTLYNQINVVTKKLFSFIKYLGFIYSYQVIVLRDIHGRTVFIIFICTLPSIKSNMYTY